MPRPHGPTYQLARELTRKTDFSERSIRHWLATSQAPKNPILAAAWTKAVAAAKAKIARAAS